jgi:hypothetical protein
MGFLSDSLERHLREIQNPSKVVAAKPEVSFEHIVATKSLFFKEGTSDKEYHVQVVRVSATNLDCHVKFQYGRRGKTLIEGSKTSNPVSIDEARRLFNEIVNAKIHKGYK